jgi:hypothetical protein
MFVRGNHEMRGAFARDLLDYVPTPEGRYYYALDHGPLHLIILDTGEDKADETNVYAGLNKVEPYRLEEYAWFERHLENDRRAAGRPSATGTENAAASGRRWPTVEGDLILGGHLHRLSKVEPGTQGNEFTALALGQDQVGRVEATARELRVTVCGTDGKIVETLTIQARR